MGPELVEEILLEYDTVRDPAGDPELEALKTALFVEHAFGIVLSDDEIRSGLGADVGTLRGLVLRRLGAD
jgi:hypothetical protein